MHKHRCVNNYEKNISNARSLQQSTLFYLAAKVREVEKNMHCRSQHELNGEDAYLCLLISNNSEPENRKAFDVNLGGFADFQKKNKMELDYIVVHSINLD